MINFKYPARKRNIRRDRDDDLSIVTGGRPIIRFGNNPGSAQKQKRVRNYDEKLKRDFADARATAYLRKGERPPGLHTPSTFIHYPATGFTTPINPNSSLTFPVPSSPKRQFPDRLEGTHPHNGQYTISSVPSLLKTSQSRQAVLNSQPRDIVKLDSRKQSPIYGHLAQPYWTVHANTEKGQKRKLASTVYNMNTKGSGKKNSSWKICSSMPMTRTNASLVQMEMVSTMCGVESNVSSTSTNFPTPPTNQGMLNHCGMRSMMPPRQTVIPTLIKRIVPPPSPLVPVSPNTINSFNPVSNFGATGVHQSEWIDRSKCVNRALTKQYSMEHIIDILCGFSTPDSNMANQLFEPLPSMSAAASSSPKNQPKMYTTTASAKVYFKPSNNLATETLYRERDADDDDETSVYFSESSKRKTVSFLTDNEDNVCVTKHFFDPFTQEMYCSNSNDLPVDNKENNDPNIFANVLPQYSTPKESITVFNSMSSVFNTSPLPELKGIIFNTSDSESSSSNTTSVMPRVVPDALKSTHPVANTRQQNSLEMCSSESQYPSYSPVLFATPTVSPAVPLFELGSSNTVGLADSISGSGSTPSRLENSVRSEGSEQHPNEQSLHNSFSSICSPFNDIISHFDLNKLTNPPTVPADIEHVHPSWNDFLNDLCSGSSSQASNFGDSQYPSGHVNSNNGSSFTLPNSRIVP